jgi:hypothetical protein
MRAHGRQGRLGRRFAIVIGVAAAAVAVTVIAVPAASAGVRSAAYLSMHQAEKGAMRSAKERSDFSTPSGGYGVVRCHRISGQKVRCKDFAEFHDRHNCCKHTVTWWVAVTRDERGHLLYRNLKGTEHNVPGYPYD